MEKPGICLWSHDSLGIMRSFGHTGLGPGSTIALYHFPNGKNKVTVASSKIEEEQSVSEYEVIEIAKNEMC